MALTILTGSSQAAATNYSYTTSGSSDWSSVPTSSNFYDVIDKVVRYKTVNNEYVNAQTASYSSKTNFLANNGYIGDTTYGTQVFHATGSFTGSATSSLVTLKSMRTDLLGLSLLSYNLRTDIVGAYSDTAGSEYVIGGTLNATFAHNLTNGGVYFIGPITQIKNTDFTGTLPEFTYKIDISGSTTLVNLKATGKSGDNTYPIKWSSVTYMTTGVEVNTIF
jgi:hypothetical protein